MTTMTKANTIPSVSVCNIANAITFTRVLMAFMIFVMAIWYPDQVFVIFVLSLTASLSDLADGAVARYTNKSSQLGSLFDRIADKILFIAVLVAIVFNDKTPLTWTGFLVFQVVIDIYFLCRCWNFRNFAAEVGANFCSKTKITLLYAACLGCLLNIIGLIPLSEKFVAFVSALFTASIMMTFSSFYGSDGYFARLQKASKSK